MALLRKRKSRKTGEDLYSVVPTADELIQKRGVCEFSDEFLLNFLKNVQAVVTDCIDAFFKGRQLHCGGDIEEDVLHCPAYVSMVMNTDVSRGVDVVYDVMQRSRAAVSEETKQDFVIRLLDSCAPMGIPKCFSGGLMLMYMELCLGTDLRPSLESLGRAA